MASGKITTSVKHFLGVTVLSTLAIRGAGSMLDQALDYSYGGERAKAGERSKPTKSDSEKLYNGPAIDKLMVNGLNSNTLTRHLAGNRWEQLENRYIPGVFEAGALSALGYLALQHFKSKEKKPETTVAVK